MQAMTRACFLVIAINPSSGRWTDKPIRPGSVSGKTVAIVISDLRSKLLNGQLLGKLTSEAHYKAIFLLTPNLIVPVFT